MFKAAIWLFWSFVTEAIRYTIDSAKQEEIKQCLKALGEHSAASMHWVAYKLALQDIPLHHLDRIPVTLLSDIMFCLKSLSWISCKLLGRTFYSSECNFSILESKEGEGLFRRV